MDSMKETSKVHAPTMRHRVASMLLAGTMTVSLGAGALATPLMAFAEPATGTVTVTEVTGNEGTFYNAFQIFNAVVGADGMATDIEWANSGIQSAVEGVIRTHAGTWTAEDQAADASHVAGQPKYTGTTAQDALEYINANWGTSDDERIVLNADFANAIARAVLNLPADQQVTAVPGEGAEFTLNEGWALITTNSGSLKTPQGTPDPGTGEMGTSPIFVKINDTDPVTIQEKATVPTITKKVKESAGDNYANYIDAERGQNVSFEIVGTLPANLKTFDTFSYVLTDTIESSRMTIDANSIKVYRDTGSGKPSELTADEDYSLAVTSSGLTVTMASDFMLGCSPTDKIVVDYDAAINASSVIGGTGNRNEAYITYSNNPNTNGTGQTSRVDARVYTYQLEMTKVDKNSQSTVLPGAKFTIQCTNADDAASTGKYVQADGSLGTTAYKFTTNANGQIAVAGLDAGTYTITEVDPPQNYDALPAPIVVTITPTFTAPDTLSDLAATLTGGEGDGADADNDGIVESGTGIYAIDVPTGKITVKATDDKKLDMPLTGAQGIMLITVAGAGLVAVSVGAIARNRRKADAAE